MTTLHKGDNDLHYEDGTHRGTPPTTDGHQLDLYEARIRRHLAEHEANKAATDRRCACAHNTDGTTTTFLCPVHADADPCLTKAMVTGRRRKGSIVSGVCTNCRWHR